MKCPNCESEQEEGAKYCTNCGAPLGAEKDEESSKTIQMAASSTPTLPAMTVQGPSISGKKQGGRRTLMIVLVVVLGLLIVGGAVAGIIAWRVSAGNKPVADVQKVELRRSDGKTLNLKKVPLDVTLVLKASFIAKFKEDGRGSIKLLVEDDNGNSIVEETYDVKSSGKVQTKELEFDMTQSEGLPLEARAELKVKQEGKDLSDNATLAYTAVKGQGKEAELEEAKTAAENDLELAAKAIDEASGLGIDVDDLAQTLDDATSKLDSAETVEEVEEVSATAQSIIEECDSRKAELDDEHGAVETCRENQTALRQAIMDYADIEGNYPDSLDMLVDQGYLDSLPVCPSGGTYSYEVDYSVTPETLTVECSVHGVLLPGI